MHSSDTGSYFWVLRAHQRNDGGVLREIPALSLLVLPQMYFFLICCCSDVELLGMPVHSYTLWEMPSFKQPRSSYNYLLSLFFLPNSSKLRASMYNHLKTSPKLHLF